MGHTNNRQSRKKEKTVMCTFPTIVQSLGTNSAVKLVLFFTYFTFNNITYKQIFGTPMGASLFPIIADCGDRLTRLTRQSTLCSSPILIKFAVLLKAIMR